MSKAYVGEAPLTVTTTLTEDTKLAGIDFLKRFWVGFHNLIIIALLFSLLGIGIGVKVSHQFYVEKLSEVVQTGAMLHNKKVYSILPKI